MLPYGHPWAILDTLDVFQDGVSCFHHLGLQHIVCQYEDGGEPIIISIIIVIIIIINIILVKYNCFITLLLSFLLLLQYEDGGEPRLGGKSVSNPLGVLHKVASLGLEMNNE